MPRNIIKTENAPRPGGHYSQGIQTDNLIFVAGQVGTNPKTGQMVEGISEQTRQALTNVKSIIEAGGSSLENVVRVGVYLRDIKDFVKMNEVYQTFFPQNPPARTTIQAMLAANFLIEIDAIALSA